MRGVLLLLCTMALLHAGIFDFLEVNKAHKNYENKDYKAAIKSYKKLENKEGARYDLANSYYKNKQYKKALESYEKITDKNLEFKKLHNLGNTYAHLGKIDDAIKSYEAALKIKKDKDTQYNLDLLKKQKKEQQKKQNKNQKKKQQDKKQNNKNQQNQQNKNDQKNNKNQKNQQNKNDQNKNNQRKKDQQNKSQEQQNKNQQKTQNKDEKKSTPEAKKQQKKQAQASVKKAPPISDMEERKYQKMLDHRGVNTLMLPIKSKGDLHHETNPW